jgi:hypothetical protein
MNDGALSMMTVEGSISQPQADHVPLDMMHDIEFNIKDGEGAVSSPATVPGNGSFLKRSSSKSPKPSSPDKKRQQHSDEDSKILIPTLGRDSDVTVNQRGDRFPSTWTALANQSEISLGPGVETPSFEPRQGSIVESNSTHAAGESSEKVRSFRIVRDGI